MLDYKLLEAMVAVVQEGGFEKAAQVLHLTQPAVSHRVKLLEELTGQILLVRTSPPKPTPAGQRMIKHCLQVKGLEKNLLDMMSPSSQEDFVSMAVGINDDSLAIWFIKAVQPFLEQERVVLDMRVDDQEQTHRLLRDGEVMGCISSQDQPMQGCRTDKLGKMDYRLFATPDFATRWFPDGFNAEAVRRAPAVIFNRKDNLHGRLIRMLLGTGSVPDNIPVHYIPSSDRFVDFVALGFAYGVIPDQQSVPLVRAGKLINLVPSCKIPVELYWHCWNLKSRVLEKFTRNLVRQARMMLGE